MESYKNRNRMEKNVKSKNIAGLVYLGLAAVATVLLMNEYFGHPPAEEGVMAVIGMCAVAYLIGFSGK